MSTYCVQHDQQGLRLREVVEESVKNSISDELPLSFQAQLLQEDGDDSS